MAAGQMQIPGAVPKYRNAQNEHLFEGNSFSLKENAPQIKHDICVFLVDDDKFFLNGLYYYLADSLSPRIKLKTFSNAEDCLASMKDKPGIIVLDYTLSSDSSKSMNGLEALKKISELSPETFVIMLSAQDNIDVAIDTLNAGAYDYLSKSETAFLRLKNIVRNIAETISGTIEMDKREANVKKINLLIILLLLLLFVIGRIVH